jgi:hypothetical protein
MALWPLKLFRKRKLLETLNSNRSVYSLRSTWLGAKQICILIGDDDAAHHLMLPEKPDTRISLEEYHGASAVYVRA